jgi:cell division protein FtsW
MSAAKREKRRYAGGATARYLLLGSALFLTVFGLVMIYSASSITASVKWGSSMHFAGRQVIFILGCSAVAWWIARHDYRNLRDRATLLWGGSLVLLLLAIVVGVVRKGARRWIPLGLFNLQPSELAKIACVILVSSIAVDWMRGRIPTRSLLARVGVATIVPALIIILQPDMGTTVTLVVGVALVLWLAGVDWRWAAAAIGGGVVLGAIAILSADYRRERFLAYLNPWANPADAGYQTIQALYAFGSGGLGGVGLGLSRQKFFYLPEAHNDFILAIIGEEVGLLGTLATVLALGVFVWAGFRIATGTKDPFGRLVAGAVTGMMAFQAFLNMAAVTGIIPVTGKPLPFLSYGGSSMLVTMVSLGLILSVSTFGAQTPRAVRQRSASERNPVESAPERRRDGGSHLPGAGRRTNARRRA